MAKAKIFKVDLDLDKNQILNVKVHPVTSATRVTIGNTLTTSDVGITVYDTDQNRFYVWSGTAWLATGADITTDYNSTITGARDGINRVFTTSNSFKSGTAKVFLNGIRLTPGTLGDYEETGANQITFKYGINSIDTLIIDYIINYPISLSI
jgi:hypothetical protein